VSDMVAMASSSSTLLVRTGLAVLPLLVVGLLGDSIRSRRGRGPSRRFWLGYFVFLATWVILNLALAIYDALFRSDSTKLKLLSSVLLIGGLLLAGTYRRIHRPNVDRGRESTREDEISSNSELW
jgi:hypothetical protein